MTSQLPKLLIIPGVGDDGPEAYVVFARRWRRLGYDTEIVPFGWNETTAPYAPKFAALLRTIDACADRELYIIGVSAGGTAAINALAARPNLVQKVITVCSPLSPMPSLRNPLLAASIGETLRNLQQFTPAQKQRILSARALHDGVVAPHLSSSPGVPQVRIWFVGHAPSIFVALTLMSSQFKRFLYGK